MDSKTRWPHVICTCCISLTMALTVVGTLGVLGSSAGAAVSVGSLAASLPAQGNYGTIKGKLVWSGAQVPPKKNLVEKGAAPKDPLICANAEAIPDRSLVVDLATKGVRYGFAYIVRPQGANPGAAQALLQKKASVELDQENCEFIPHATALMQGQNLVLKSSDPISHNIRFSAFTNTAFNQLLPPNGQFKLSLVAERRPIPLACDIHPWMKGYLMVFDHPFFAVTGGDGSFEITGVPAGTQNLVVWQETVGYVTTSAARGMPVQVQAGAVTDVGEIKLNPK
jgi:hypothetical protein